MVGKQSQPLHVHSQSVEDVIQGKRSYTFKTRSEKREKNAFSVDIRLARKLDEPFPWFTEETSCCKRRQCWKHVDRNFVLTQRQSLVGTTRQERKEFLTRMRRDGSFWLNETRVCGKFLTRAFRLSKCLQGAVLGKTWSKASPTIEYRKPEVVPSPTRSRIILFLQKIAKGYGDLMPDKQEIHVPWVCKLHLYEKLVREWNHDGSPPSASYFYRTLREYAKDIKTPKIHRFSKCTACTQFDDILVRDQTSKGKIKRTIAARDRHIELVRFERKGYMERQNRAQNDPKNYCSIVIDGADQAAFGLPHFVYDTKDTVGHKLKVKLVGLKEHGHIPKICLYLMTEEFATGTNHVVETIHRWLNEKSKHGPLPPTLYIQLDNSGRENKNRYQIAYLECLVAWDVFKNNTHSAVLGSNPKT